MTIDDKKIDAFLRSLDAVPPVGEEFIADTVARAVARPQMPRRAGWLWALEQALGFRLSPSMVFVPAGSLAALCVAGFLAGQTASPDLMLDPAFYDDDIEIVLELEEFY